MKFDCSLKKYTCKIGFFNPFVDDGESAREESRIVSLICWFALFCLAFFLCFHPSIANWFGSHTSYGFLFLVSWAVLCYFPIMYLRRVVPKLSTVIDYTISLNVLQEGIEYYDSRSDVIIFIPKEKIRSMNYYGDKFYAVDNMFLELVTNVESELSYRNVCCVYGKNGLISLLKPNLKEIHYSYILPRYSDDGVNIPAKIYETFGIGISLC